MTEYQKREVFGSTQAALTTWDFIPETPGQASDSITKGGDYASSRKWAIYAPYGKTVKTLYVMLETNAYFYGTGSATPARSENWDLQYYNGSAWVTIDTYSRINMTGTGTVFLCLHGEVTGLNLSTVYIRIAGWEVGTSSVHRCTESTTALWVSYVWD